MAAVGLAERAHWQASKRFVADLPAEGTCGIIVLGFPPRHDGSIHPLARWRVEAACRAAVRLGAQTVVFSGGAHDGQPTEAAVMAEYAASLGLPPEVCRREESSTSTWENIAFSLPMVEHCERLAVISDPMHAARGRACLVAQRPDLAGRLVNGADYVPGERWWLKIPTAAYEAVRPWPISKRGAG